MAKIGRNAPCPCGSGRKYKHCCLGKRDVVGYEVKDSGQTLRVTDFGPDPHGDIPIEGWFASDDIQDDAFRTVFLGEGAEALTDEVIAELVAGGWTEADLRRMQAEGASYNRIRHSIVYPPEALPD